MEIEAEVTLTDIVKIKVNGADALAAIMEEPDSVRHVCRGLNQLAAFMQAIDDDLIRQMTHEQRSIVAKFLHEQHGRYVRWKPAGK